MYVYVVLQQFGLFQVLQLLGGNIVGYSHW
jgi:hypothetical protein